MTSGTNISGFWDKGNTLGRILDTLQKAGLSLDNLSIHDRARSVRLSHLRFHSH